MDIDVARHVIRAAFRSARELEELLSLLKDHCSAEEYRIYAKAIATTIAAVHMEIVNRVTSSLPELEKEIERTIGKYDRYL